MKSTKTQRERSGRTHGQPVKAAISVGTVSIGMAKAGLDKKDCDGDIYVQRWGARTHQIAHNGEKHPKYFPCVSAINYSRVQKKHFLWWPYIRLPDLNHQGLQPYFPIEKISYHWSCFYLLKFPSFLPENSICINPPAFDDYDFFDKLPLCVGRDRKMEEANGEMSFALFRLMYMKYTSDTSSALTAGVPAGGHWLSMYSTSYQAP